MQRWLLYFFLINYYFVSFINIHSYPYWSDDTLEVEFLRRDVNGWAEIITEIIFERVTLNEYHYS